MSPVVIVARCNLPNGNMRVWVEDAAALKDMVNMPTLQRLTSKQGLRLRLARRDGCPCICGDGQFALVIPFNVGLGRNVDGANALGVMVGVVHFHDSIYALLPISERCCPTPYQVDRGKVVEFP